jgi:N-acetyl-alpha-D-glucosaminyl L-malate synthase BshA
VTKPLSIAMVCYPSFGGSGVIARELAVGLVERGHRVTLVASAPPFRPLPAQDGLAFLRVEVPHYPMFEHAPYTLAVASALIEHARRAPTDVIHVHYAVPHATSGWLAAQALAPHAPALVTTLHGTDVTGSGADASYAPVTRLAVRASQAVTVPSAYLEERARAWLAEDAVADTPVIDVVPNFVDTEVFAPPASRDRGVFDGLFGSRSDAPVLFHVSNFRPVKRVADLLPLLRYVRQAVPARMVVVGDGPERAALERAVRELELHESVRFLGKQVSFVDWLRHADAFVLPSESESFGLAALEAMSCGVPVLGYRVGGLPEVVTDKGGVLVPAFEIEALARATLDLLADAGRRERLGCGARESVLAAFSRAPAVERYECVFRSAVESARGAE